MRVSRQGNVFRIVRITGPQHNLLGLEFGKNSLVPEIEVLPAVDHRHSKYSPDVESIRQHVLEGVREANEEAKMNVSVIRMQIVEDDSGPPEVYRHLAKELVLRASRGECETSQDTA